MKRYYNATTKEWYTEGQSMTRRISEGKVFAGYPSEEQLYEWGFREWVAPEPTDAEKLQMAQEQKKADILAYDSSDAVNGFTLTNGGVVVTDYWLPRDIRTSLEGDVKSCMEVSETYEFDIREKGIVLKLNCKKFLDALQVLRRYAYTAYNVTSKHLANVDGLTTINEVERYDYKQGYPEKLTFDIGELCKE